MDPRRHWNGQCCSSHVRAQSKARSEGKKNKTILCFELSPPCDGTLGHYLAYFIFCDVLWRSSILIDSYDSLWFSLIPQTSLNCFWFVDVLWPPWMFHRFALMCMQIPRAFFDFLWLPLMLFCFDWFRLLHLIFFESLSLLPCPLILWFSLDWFAWISMDCVRFSLISDLLWKSMEFPSFWVD